MTYAPDYGLMLMNQGHVKGFLVSFPTFGMNHISAVEPGLFTTIVTLPVGDTDFAISVDFDHENLQEIISFCPPQISDAIVEWANNLRHTDTLQLPEPIMFSLTSTLGEIQSNDQESYVPLVAQSVSAIIDPDN